MGAGNSTPAKPTMANAYNAVNRAEAARAANAAKAAAEKAKYNALPQNQQALVNEVRASSKRPNMPVNEAIEEGEGPPQPVPSGGRRKTARKGKKASRKAKKSKKGGRK
jgi:hypothetical protein